MELINEFEGELSLGKLKWNLKINVTLGTVEKFKCWILVNFFVLFFN